MPNVLLAKLTTWFVTSVHERLFQPIIYVDILNKLKHVFMLMQYLDIMDIQRRGICLFGKCLFIHYRICEI